MCMVVYRLWWLAPSAATLPPLGLFPLFTTLLPTAPAPGVAGVAGAPRPARNAATPDPPPPDAGATAGVVGVARLARIAVTRPCPLLRPGPDEVAVLLGVAPLAAGGVVGIATFARKAATRPPPDGGPPPANGLGAEPLDWASSALIRSLIDIFAMPSAASSDIRSGDLAGAASAATYF